MQKGFGLKKRLLLNVNRNFIRNEAQIHELRYLFWECTLRCNLNCLHCGSDCRQNANLADMPVDVFLEQMRKLKVHFDPSKVMVVITGGEPLLRSDLEVVGKALRQMGYPWGLVSNGMVYTAKRHKSLMAAGMGAITFSLDGLKGSHNWLRNNPKSFDRVVDALQLVIAERRLTYDVVTCINQHNIGELEDIRDFLAKMEVKAWRIFTIAPIGRAANHEDMKLRPEQLRRLMDFIGANREYQGMKVSFSCEGFVGPWEGVVRDGFFFCRAGIHIGSILVDGSVGACPNIDRKAIQGNIYKKDFFTIWDEEFQLMRDRSWTHTGSCGQCKKYAWCMGNGLHLWDIGKQELQYCHYQELQT